MDLEIIIPVSMAIIVLLYYLVCGKNPKRRSADLYRSIVLRGCELCTGGFTVIVPRIPDERNCVTLQCNNCEKQYRINHIERKAWKI